MNKEIGLYLKALVYAYCLKIYIDVQMGVAEDNTNA